MKFQNTIKTVLLAAILTAMTLIAIGCQTIAGAGEDIKWTAEATAGLLEGQ